ncbi:BT_3987 domain-containing protein [Mucilaginibacter sp. X5P1]|uniref:BT_3987 domain-containing protein n=1 Tax=Mucilaginibacter sp. X5P1 TaxID=2723088 RepID=UPI00161E816E|nr:DUF1735 domain-containing protein [Mucilaginibacter sp. X5P1]MBB6140207.1 hypothetical protein [Mucilaginibacter sp. X5P1]
MKKTFTKTRLIAIASLCCIAMFSCKKDRNNTKEPLIYINNTDTAHKEFSMQLIFVGSQVFGSTGVKMAASVTEPAPADIQARFVLDTNMVSTYNTKNKTTYVAIPASAFTLANGGLFTIKKGATVSDSISLTLVNPKQLTNPKGYLIPLTIKSTNGQDNMISSTSNTLFAKVTSTTATLQLKTDSAATAGVTDQSLNITPSGNVLPNTAVTFAAYTNVSLPANVTLNIEANDGLVAAYNKQNNTSFSSMPSNSYSIVNGGAATINAGTAKSNNFEVDLNAAMFSTDSTKTYLLPLAIKGGDNSAGNLMYIRITPVVTNIKPGNLIPVGTNVDRSSWEPYATSTGSHSVLTNFEAYNVRDGDYTTYWVDDPYGAGLPQSITIPMGETDILKGLTYATGSYFGQYDFAPRQITILTSTDGITWKKQGVYSGPDSPETIVNGISFYTPVTARYLRLICTSTYALSDSWVGFSEINGVK